MTFISATCATNSLALEPDARACRQRVRHCEQQAAKGAPPTKHRCFVKWFT
jgi:hypothetical protein